jgi:hypothetical protein
MEIIVTTPAELKFYINEVFLEILTKANFQKPVGNVAKKYLSFEEAAKYLDVAHPTLYAYNSKKVIPYFNKGRKAYYLQADLDNFINSLRKKTSAELTEQAVAKIQNKKK